MDQMKYLLYEAIQLSPIWGDITLGFIAHDQFLDGTIIVKDKMFINESVDNLISYIISKANDYRVSLCVDIIENVHQDDVYIFKPNLKAFDQLWMITNTQQINNDAWSTSMVFVQKIINQIVKLGWTKHDLANLSGVSYNRIVDMFSVDEMITFEDIARFQKAFDMYFDIKLKKVRPIRYKKEK